MSLFQRIGIEGYRRLDNVQVEMRPLTVMIGANGVGKTSLLEIFLLLAASARMQLESKISELSGLGEIMTRSDTADSITFSLSMSVSNGEPLNYYLKLVPKGQFYEIAVETLTQQRNRCCNCTNRCLHGNQ